METTATRAVALTLGGLMLAYAISVGHAWYIWPSTGLVMVALIGLAKTPTSAPTTTRYREQRFGRSDWLIMGSATGALLAFLAVF